MVHCLSFFPFLPYSRFNIIYTNTVSSIFKTNAVLAKYSRLFIDLNRDKNHINLITEKSDGVEIPGNKNLTKSEKLNRSWIFLSIDFSGITLTFRLSSIASMGYFLTTSKVGAKILLGS